MLKNKISKEDFDKLPAVIQAEYSLSGDSYFLQAEEAVTLGDTLKRERAEKEEKARELARIQGELGNLKSIDPERYRKLVEAEDKKAELDALAEKDFEAAKRLAVESATKPLIDKLTKLEAELGEERQYTNQSTVGEKLNAWIGTHVAPQHQRAFRALIETDYKPEVKREGKERKPVFKEAGLEVGFDDFLAKLPEQEWAKHYLLSEQNGSGGGAEAGKIVTGQGASGKVQTVKKTDIAAIRENSQGIMDGSVQVVD